MKGKPPSTPRYVPTQRETHEGGMIDAGALRNVPVERFPFRAKLNVFEAASVKTILRGYSLRDRIIIASVLLAAFSTTGIISLFVLRLMGVGDDPLLALASPLF